MGSGGNARHFGRSPSLRAASSSTCSRTRALRLRAAWPRAATKAKLAKEMTWRMASWICFDYSFGSRMIEAFRAMIALMP